MATRPQQAVEGDGVAQPRRWHFANAVLDERTLQLCVDGAEVEIERKPFEVLRFLLQHAGELVTKDDMLGAVWPGRFLSETVLTKSISRLRDVLRDERQEVIKTLHGYGYRLLAQVRIEDGDPAATTAAAQGMSVLVVDDHELFRAGIKLLLADFAEGLTFRDVANCAQALALAESTVFDVVLLDFHLPGLQGMDALRAIREKAPQATIVVLSGEDDPVLIRQVIENGAAGFIPKTSSHAVMIAALRLIIAGGTYLPPQAFAGLPAARTKGATNEELLDQLTPRQIHALKLALQGKSDELIAAELRLPKASVSATLAASFEALGVQNRTDAIFEAARAQLQLSAAR
jgi:DNA-binding NarL/FixJ family response regulator/DNA-binding winged helix-turn-helix (wHTH) protein